MTEAAADVVVVDAGDVVVGISGDTGAELYSGRAADVVQQSLDHVDPHGRIVVRGNLEFDHPIHVRKPVDYQHAGVMYPRLDPGEAAVVVGDETSQVAFSRIRIGNVVGDGYEADAFRFRNAAYNRIEVQQIATFRYAIYLDQASASANVSQNHFNYLQIVGGKKGFYAAAPPSGESPAPAQANKLVGGGIFATEGPCVHLERGSRAGGTTIVGTIDNASDAGPSREDSPDYVNELAPERLGSLLFMDFVREGHSTFHPRDVVLNPYGVEDSGILMGVGSAGALGILPDVTLERPGPRQLSTNSSFGIRCDSGHYGGDFGGYAPPDGHEGAMVIAEDRDATPPKVREYVYSNGQWHHAAFTPAGP